MLKELEEEQKSFKTILTLSSLNVKYEKDITKEANRKRVAAKY